MTHHITTALSLSLIIVTLLLLPTTSHARKDEITFGKNKGQKIKSYQDIRNESIEIDSNNLKIIAEIIKKNNALLSKQVEILETNQKLLTAIAKLIQKQNTPKQ